VSAPGDQRTSRPRGTRPIACQISAISLPRVPIRAVVSGPRTAAGRAWHVGVYATPEWRDRARNALKVGEASLRAANVVRCCDDSSNLALRYDRSLDEFGHAAVRKGNPPSALGI
jgi:hypothetical protein